MDIPQLAGHRSFISCWIYKSDNLVFVVDPGPASTIPVLLKALRTLDIRLLDYILLTHIHLDHAGGAGHLLQNFPEAQINCHPRGISHLIDPGDLWKGSLNVLGKVAEAYKAMKPVPENSVSYHPKIGHNGKAITVTETPGHASHHVCYQFEDILFAGEVAGVHVPSPGNTYLRIATPPRFIYEVYKKSLLKTSKIPARYICFGHYGMCEDPENIFQAALQQLDLWLDTVRKYLDLEDRVAERKIFNELLKTDVFLSAYNLFDEDIRKREDYFSRSSIRGMLDYFRRE